MPGPAMDIGSVIHRLGVCASTSDTAREFAQAGAPHGTVVVAEEQTRGRGTKGRVWHSLRGKGLYASFILRYEPCPGRLDALSILPLAGGLAGAEAVLGASGVPVRLKWPNDLVWGRRKLGGILSESVFHGDSPTYSIVGVGINMSHEEPDFPEEIRPWATSLKLAAGKDVDREDLLARLCRTLGSWYNAILEGRREDIIRAYQEKMAFSPGDRITVARADDRISGTYLGLSPEGWLNVAFGKARETVFFEEIRALDWA